MDSVTVVATYRTASIATTKERLDVSEEVGRLETMSQITRYRTSVGYSPPVSSGYMRERSTRPAQDMYGRPESEDLSGMDNDLQKDGQVDQVELAVSQSDECLARNRNDNRTVRRDESVVYMYVPHVETAQRSMRSRPPTMPVRVDFCYQRVSLTTKRSRNAMHNQ